MTTGVARPWRRWILLAVGWLAIVSAGTAAGLEVELHGDRLSVQAERVPLRAILARLVRQGGITVRIDPHIDPQVSAAFRDRDLRAGLDSLLKPLNYVLVWETLSGGAPPAYRLKEIQVFEPGAKERMQPLAPVGNLRIGRDPADGSFFVLDEVWVQRDPHADPALFDALLAQVGAVVVEANQALGLYRLRLPEGSDVPAMVARLGAAPGVTQAEPNYAYPVERPVRLDVADPPPTPPAGAARATGVPVAVLDSGLAAAFSQEAFVLASLDALDPGAGMSDALGHGTQMALIAGGQVRPYGAAAVDTHPGVIAIRAFDDNGFTSNDTLMRSIAFAVSQGARVLSLSWGSETRSAFLERAFSQAADQGLVIVASAGNEPTGRPVYPAAFETVIAVGAKAPNGRTWQQSNYGEFVKVYAPGFANLPVGYQGDPGIYAGTSIAAAFTANRIATFLAAHPQAGREAVLAALGTLR